MTLRYRALSPAGDYTFGAGPKGQFLVDSPEAVAQALATRLALYEGEWFLDQTAGTPWFQSIVGDHTGATYDAAIRAAILGTVGVTAIAQYSSSVTARNLRVAATVDTQFSGQATVAGAVGAPGSKLGPLVTDTGAPIVTDGGGTIVAVF